MDPVGEIQKTLSKLGIEIVVTPNTIQNIDNINKARIGMVYMSKRQEPQRDENVRPKPPIGLQ